MRNLPIPGANVLVALAATGFGLAACAAAPVGADDVRVLVKLATPSTDAEAIAAEASRRTGVPVRYVSAAGERWHALVLHCASPAACDAAVQRMASAADVYQSVQADQRKRAALP